MTNEQEIRNLCEANGLSVSDLRLADDVLVVTPASLDHLPDADTLVDLGDKLREVSSARYVTLAIDHETTGDR
jgi:hypothetical protein